MNAPTDKSYDASLAVALADADEAAAYLDAVMELEDPAALVVALRQVAKAHGMAEVARRADVGELLKLHMQKIEELTLYIIAQEKRIKELESQLKK